ncbi:MAG: histidine kinase [Bdellovibrionaceae bacterium]|nr:histidine kinase [Pseudobdellovibrionaceae bacterium]
MSAIIHKFLLVGPWPKSLAEIGAVIVNDLYEANYQFDRSQIDVLGINLTAVLEKRFFDLYTKWKQNNPHLQVVVVIPSDFSKKSLLDLQWKYSFSKIFTSYSDKNIEQYLNLSLEKSYQEKQFENYRSLLEEQSKKLEKLKYSLDDKIEKRTKFLVESRRKLFLTNIRIESFRKALTAVYQSHNLAELEKNLNEELLRTFEIQWIKILFAPQDEQFVKELESQLQYQHLRFRVHKQNNEIGSVFFMRSLQKPFAKEESEFLARVAEAVSIATERFENRVKLERIHDYWKTLFNAIKDAIILIDPEYNIIQTNMEKFDGQKKCHEFLFGKSSPCEGCRLGQKFEIQHINESFEVAGQLVVLEGRRYAIHYYRNTTKKHELEKELLELAPKAELGILSSSIAHEINNPLGGLLSYTQLLLMDTNESSPMHTDLKSMEIAIKKCAEIVNNLLVNTRT